MELARKFAIELGDLEKAIHSFEAGLNATYADLDDIGVDLIQNGRIQKFEYCTELAWKVSKLFLELNTGLIAASPKTVYRSLFQNNFIDESLLMCLFECIEDRNKLSHIYKLEIYQLIHADLPKHLLALKLLLALLHIKLS